jgi:TRAP-type mannitol/chloroaromatic compound transport system permease small subunit
MPELSFVMPHWLYWSGLLLFPLAAMIMYRRSVGRPRGRPISLGLGYFLLLTGGFVGVHRLYLRSAWAAAFMLAFVAVLLVNVQTREAREGLSEANNRVNLAELKIRRGERAVEKNQQRLAERESERTRRKLEQAKADLAQARVALAEAQDEQAGARAVAERWHRTARGIGLALLLGILTDALLLPWLVGRRNAHEGILPPEAGFQCPAVEREHEDRREPYAFNRAVSRLNGFAGELVAYWSLIAVFVYYYEVIARYVFNSPTNWAHEGMFLMFGMQYLIAGGFCLRENAHVRVDVLYTHLSKRAKAIMDLVTSVFFFIFVLTLLVTGWIFFHDAFEIREVSFTEWHIQYWPVKLALPLGAALLLLQGVAQLVKDIAVVMHPRTVELDTEVRPEG